MRRDWVVTIGVAVLPHIATAATISTETVVIHAEADAGIAPHFFISENAQEFIIQTPRSFGATDYALISAFDAHGTHLWERTEQFKIFLEFNALSGDGRLFAIRHTTTAYSELDLTFPPKSSPENL